VATSYFNTLLAPPGPCLNLRLGYIWDYFLFGGLNAILDRVYYMYIMVRARQNEPCPK